MTDLPKPWTAEEDAILRLSCKNGRSRKLIAAYLLTDRTETAIKKRIHRLGCSARRDPDWKPKAPAKRKSRAKDPKADPMLPVLLRFGLRHRVDLGMGREAFLAAAAQHGLLKEAA